ncbi:MAG: gluconokinase [Eubacteriales bacterium]|nr:gluconokinase [Eubacteriales bacterium]
MADNYYLGIDLGTSSVRAVLFNHDGQPVHAEQRETPLMTETAATAELDPDLIFDQLIEVVSQSTRFAREHNHHIRAIGWSTQLHSLMAVDKSGRPLTRLMTWADSRANDQADEISRQFDSDRLYSITGCRAQHPLYPLSKILWLKECQPDVFARAHRFISIKTYLTERLCGEYLIDITDASATACFNIREFRWDPYILKEILGLEPHHFARPVACEAVLPPLKPQMRLRLGLEPETLIVAGTGDGIAANLGCGIFDDSAMTSTIGTSGAIRTTVRQPLLDPRQRTWCYCLSDHLWVAGGAINNGGIVLRWLRDQFLETFKADAAASDLNSVYAQFDRYAADLPAGSDGLIFLPLLTGERSPNWNARTRGVLYGLDIRHSRAHIVRAAMEGILYQMYSVYQALASISGSSIQIRANGGYARSEIWPQMQADLFGQPIAVSTVSEASALGAAYLGMLAAGTVSHLGETLPAMAVHKIFQPDPAQSAVYQSGFQLYQDIYQRLYR